MEVIKLYKYAEEKVDKNTVNFGWRDTDSLSEDEDWIESYHSRSKFASEEEVSSSKKEGVNRATVSDYWRFFENLTGSDPASFYDKWDGKDEELKMHWKVNFPYADEKQHLFMIKLSRLLISGKKFVMYSRGFKMVKSDERGNTATEV